MTSSKENPSEERPQNTSIRTLVVDDSPVMLKTLAQILANEDGFTLIGAVTDGCQALRQVLGSSPDLVLMDFHLPHLNGVQATQYIKQFENPPVVIIITSDDHPNARLIAKEAGADAFVVKTEDFHAQLRAKLRELFGMTVSPLCQSENQSKSL